MATLAEILRQTGYAQDGALTTPAPTQSPMTKALSEHIKTLPQQLATNQAALDNAIGSWNKTDFATGQPNPNYRPEAIQELTQLMPNVMGATAWHGTPHKIQGAFDISKVGTGEGAQHYGHGMYFAESPAIASEYKGSDAVKLFANGVETESPVAKQIVRYGSPEEYVKSMQKVIEKKAKTLQNASKEEILPGLSDYDMAKMDLDNLLNKVEEAKSYKSVETRPVGNLYKVDIPDEQIPKTLNWYESFKNQPEEVQQALRNLGPEIKFGSGKESVADWLKMTGDLPPHLKNQSGNAIYHELAKQLGGAKEASAYLNKLGIKGIKYENFQIRNGAGGGTHNYVMFDPSTVKILEENGKPLTRKEILEKQINQLENTNLLKGNEVDVSDTFGKGAKKIQYKDPNSEGFINLLVKPDGTASVLGLEVSEKFRGKGIGQKLQEQAMKDYPELQGQVSSKAAAKTAYRLGRRPVGQPNATLDDVFKVIDEDSSVNLVTPMMQKSFNK